jgi:hypothetical protein
MTGSVYEARADIASACEKKYIILIRKMTANNAVDVK